MFEKLSSEDLMMAATEEASQLVRLLAEPRPVGDTVKQAVARSWHRICTQLKGVEHTWTHSRTLSVWYADRRIKISADELTQLRALQGEVKVRRDDIKQLFERVARIETTLRVADEAFYLADIDGLRAAARPAQRQTDQSSDLGRALDRKPLA